jgi:hypothetical protein
MTDKKREVVIDAAVRLTGLADRFSRAAQSMTRMVARLATEDDATKVVTSIAKYVNSGMPEAEAVADVAAVLEGAQSPDWQQKRAKARQKSQQNRLEWQLSRGAVNEHDRPSFGGVVPEAAREIVLEAARHKRDLIAAAVAACEQRSDSAEILASLGRFLAGEDFACHLESALRSAGLSVEAGNVVPFIPQRRLSMTPARERLLRLALAMPEAGVTVIAKSIVWICPGLEKDGRPIDDPGQGRVAGQHPRFCQRPGAVGECPT